MEFPLWTVELSPALVTSPVWVRTVMLMLPANPADRLRDAAIRLLQAGGDRALRLALIEAQQCVDWMVRARELTRIQGCMLRADFDQMAQTLTDAGERHAACAD